MSQETKNDPDLQSNDGEDEDENNSKDRKYGNKEVPESKKKEEQKGEANYCSKIRMIGSTKNVIMRLSYFSRDGFTTVQ